MPSRREPPPGDPLLLDVSLFLLAWLGHACFMMLLLNMAYSRPWNREILKKFRLLMGLWIFLGPLLYYSIYGQINPLKSDPQTPLLRLMHGLYIGIAYGFACVGLAMVTIARLLRRPPRQLLDEKTEVFDVVGHLGYAPVGDGKYKKFITLPLVDHFHVEFTTLTIGFANIPTEWDGLTLLHLTDMHFIGTPGRPYFDAVIDKCLEYGPHDLVLMTGDFIDTNDHIAWMEPTLGRLKWNDGAFAVLGNHDWWQDSEAVRAKLREMNVTVLGNCWKAVKVKGQPMTVIGHEGPWFRPGPDVWTAPSGVFRLLLSHTPDYFGWAGKHGISLMLAGHNHGGQFRLPVFGSIFVPSWQSRRYDAGTFAENGTVLHVGRGMSSKEPIRINCRPQVTRIVFRKIEGGRR